MSFRWLICFICGLMMHPVLGADSLEVSLITIGPGSDLYSIYGHTGLRVHNVSKRSDVMYNYGTFDFDEGNFYLKFIRGKLMYRISKSKYIPTIKYYKDQDRSIIEQKLQLSTIEKQRIADALYENYKPANRKYLYDFFFDNCSTRIRDMLDRSIPNLQWEAKDPRFTFRDLLKQYHGGWEWYDFGVDLIVGANADRLMSSVEEMYLPDYLYGQADAAFNKNQSLVSKVNPIHVLIKDNSHMDRTSIDPWSGPVIIALVLAVLQCLFLCLYFLGKDWAWVYWIDQCMLFLYGVAGCIVLFMWIGTDHDSTKNNFNLLWLHPLYFWLGLYKIQNRFGPRLTVGISLLILVLLLLSIGVFLLGFQYVHLASWFLIIAMLFLAIRKTLILKNGNHA